MFRRRGYKRFKRGFRGSSLKARAYKLGGSGNFARPRAEVKSMDVAQFTAALNTAGTVTCLNGLTQGSGQWNRDGSEVGMMSLRVRAFLTFSGNANVAQSTQRIAIVYDKQPNKAACTFSDIFQDRNNAGTTSNNVWAGVNLDNRDRFVILYDECWSWPVTPAVDTITSQTQNIVASQNPEVSKLWCFDKYFKLGGLKACYGANAGTIGDITTGALLFVAVGSVASTTEPFAIVVNTRLRFRG